MSFKSFVGAPRIELGLPAPKAGVLPVYYAPDFSGVGLPGIEPGLHPPHGCVLPVYYSPKQITITSRLK